MKCDDENNSLELLFKLPWSLFGRIISWVVINEISKYLLHIYWV